MSDELRGALLVFAMLSALGAVPVLLRRLRPALVLALHAVGVSVGLGVALAAAVGGGDARALLVVHAVVVGLVGVGALPTGAFGRWRELGTAVAGLGLSSAAAALSGISLPWLRWGVALVGAAFAWAAAGALLQRARGRRVPSQRAGDRASALASAICGAAVLLGQLDSPAAEGLWPVLLGAASALVTAARTPPHLPPTAREWVAALFFALAASFALAVRQPPAAALSLSASAAFLLLAVLALSRPLLVGARLLLRSPPRTKREVPLPGEGVAPAALGLMPPLLDDALLRRPARPRVVARVHARRLLEAALERAREGQSSALRKARRLELDIRDEDGDVDIEGDPADLAEALCAVLDNALGLRERHPEVQLQVYVRGGPAHVTFEILDDLALHLGPNEALPEIDPGHPFLSARTGDARRPGLGLGLARARFLVERQGGKLLTRRTPEGSCVQLTVPRRQNKGQVGMA